MLLDEHAAAHDLKSKACLGIRFAVEAQTDFLTARPSLHDLGGLALLARADSIACLQLLEQHMGQVQQVMRVTLGILLLCFAKGPAPMTHGVQQASRAPRENRSTLDM